MGKAFSFSSGPYHRQPSRYPPNYILSEKSDSIISNTALSISSTAMLAHEQDFGAPVAVPFVCSKCSPANIELLFV